METHELHLDCRYYYSHLTDEEKEYYVFAARCLLNMQFTFVPPSNLTVDGMYRVFEAIDGDFPELFYFDYPNFNLDSYGVIYTYPLPYSRAEIYEIWDKLDEILHRFDHITDPFLLELAVHDFIIENYDYEDDHLIMKGRKFREIFTVAAPIKTGRGVCAALTKMIQYVMIKRDVPVVYVTGYAFPAEDVEKNPEILSDYLKAHAWLAIKLEDSYYHLDITQNETVSKTPDEPQYLAFNITDEELLKTTWYDVKLFPDIACHSIKYNYYKHMNRIFDTHDDVVKAIKEFALLHKESETTPLYFAFCLSDGADETDIPALTKILSTELRGMNIKSFSMEGYVSGHISIRIDKLIRPKTDAPAE